MLTKLLMFAGATSQIDSERADKLLLSIQAAPPYRLRSLHGAVPGEARHVCVYVNSLWRGARRHAAPQQRA